MDDPHILDTAVTTDDHKMTAFKIKGDDGVVKITSNDEDETWKLAYMEDYK